MSKQENRFLIKMGPDMRHNAGLSVSRKLTDGTGVDCTTDFRGRLYVLLIQLVYEFQFKMAVRRIEIVSALGNS